MALERTFSIIKPDATRRNLTGAINARIEAAGLRIVAQKRVHMTRAQAETFYGVHRERPFFGELVEMMTAAPVVVQVLEGDDAIQRYRDVMGATNPEKAAAGTIRKDFALSMGENSVHGSDAPATAASRDRAVLLRQRDRRLNLAARFQFCDAGPWARRFVWVNGVAAMQQNKTSDAYFSRSSVTSRS